MGERRGGRAARRGGDGGALRARAARPAQPGLALGRARRGPHPALAGWTYFRRSPWTMPPGANPDFGMELGSAIYFADAVPLLAFALKALRGVVEVPQYVGPWLLACGALQGLVGWRLVGLATRDPLARACGAGLLALQPMLMHRMTGHTSLAGQWLLLAALVLALAPGGGGRRGRGLDGAAGRDRPGPLLPARHRLGDLGRGLDASHLVGRAGPGLARPGVGGGGRAGGGAGRALGRRVLFAGRRSRLRRRQRLRHLRHLELRPAGPGRRRGLVRPAARPAGHRPLGRRGQPLSWPGRAAAAGGRRRGLRAAAGAAAAPLPAARRGAAGAAGLRGDAPRRRSGGRSGCCSSHPNLSCAPPQRCAIPRAWPGRSPMH